MTKNSLMAVLGYGSQGRAIALNLRDSGYRVVVGLRAQSKSRKVAHRDKIKVADVRKAEREADIIIVAIPDHVHRTVLSKDFFATVREQTPLVFLHGSSIHFGLVRPPHRMPVLLLAPHAPGAAVRRNYLSGTPFSAFGAVCQGSPKKGFDLLIKLAGAIGISRKHLIKTTFAHEAIGDLFGEQAVLCGGLARLLKYGFETLVEAGLPPQNAYLEVAYQIDLIVELVKQHGLSGMLNRISPMAKYGAVRNGPRVITTQVRRDMKKILTEIQSGQFISQATASHLKLTKHQRAKLVSGFFDRQVKKFRKDV